MLRNRIEKATVLDLFSGVGTVGIEALSRGSAKAIFVENNPKILRVLKKNLTSLAPSSRWKVIRADARTAHRSNALKEKSFTVIFCDPPYPALDFSIVENYLELLENNGVMVMQHPKNNVPANAAHTRVVGDNALSFWRKE